MREALRDFLLADAGVAALVGDRLSYVWREQGSPVPAVTLTVTDTERDVALGGYTGFATGFVQIDCYGVLMADALAVHLAVVSALRGANAASTGGVIQGAFIGGDADEYEGEKPERICRIRSSVRLPYNEL